MPRPRRALALPSLVALAPVATAQLTFEEFTGAAGALAWENGRAELEFGDLNGDGHPDVVTVGDHGSPFINTQMHGITAWLGDGAGGWSLVQTGSFGYGGLALGDANGDGWMDVGYGVHHDYASGDLGDQLLEVALGDGTGTGWTAWDDGLATAGETWGMFGSDFGDVDSDGDLDLGSIAFGCCAGVHVYTNDGDGGWTHTFGFLGGNSSMTFEFADFDGDGHLDLVASHADGAVHRGLGDGTFVAADGDLPSAWPRGTSAGDIDGDGRDELAYAEGGRLEVFSWTEGDAWVSRRGNLPGSGSFEATELVDMDGDGLAELCAFGDGVFVVAGWSAGDQWTLVGTAATTGPGDKSFEAFRAGVDLDHNGFGDWAVLQEESTGGLFGGTENRLVLMREGSIPTALAPKLTAPSPNRHWRGGQVRFVDWLCAVPAGETATIDLDLSTTGPGGPWTPVASDLPNNGRHQWVVPDDVHSADCHVRITARTVDGTAVQVGPVFTIDAQPAVEPWGCGVNPPGSLALTSGVPTPGGTLTLALDAPSETLPGPAQAFLFASLEPDPNAPCGTLLPGFGPAGAPGELLIALTTPDPVATVAADGLWTAPGAPVTAALPLPDVVGLLGLELYLQGALLFPTHTRLTAALRAVVGLD